VAYFAFFGTNVMTRWSSAAGVDQQRQFHKARQQGGFQHRIAGGRRDLCDPPSAGEAPNHGVETFNVLRGGEHYFLPSLSALGWLGEER
jgi:hypothetical protein